MKIKHAAQWVLFLAVSVMLAACSPTTPPEEAASYSQPQVWFDAPLPGTVFPLGEVQVVAHAADQNGVAQVEFSLADGTLVGTQPGSQSDTLLAAIFTWHPPDPGHYIFQVRAMNVNGDWSDYTYTDVVIVGEEAPAPTPEETREIPTEQPTLTPTPTTAAPVATDTPETCTDRAKFVSETVLDGTVFKPGESFTKTWTLQNAGTCTWTTRYALSFLDGEQMSGPNQVPLSKQVLPGENITLSVNLTAPSQIGTYRGRWTLMNEQGLLFGLGEQGRTAFWVEIVVAREDTRAPSVEVTYAPNGRGEPTARQQITFTADASDNVKVVKIEIYLAKGNEQAQLLNTCTNTDSCSYQVGPLNPADYHLQAFAYDAAGNRGSSVVVSFTVYR